MARLIGSRRAAAGACRGGAALLLCAWLAGCGVSGDRADGSEYLDRVGGALGQDLVPATEPEGPAWPLRRELLVAIPRIEIDAGEFIELHGCDMGALVGFRNSPLGRTQSASQRLGYEAAWLGAARRCGDAAPDWLRELVARKDAQLPALFWNALFAGDELRVAAGASRPESSADLAQWLRALRDHRQAIGRGDFDVAGFETTLAGLGSASWIGHARRDWTGWRTRLDAVRAALDANRATICRNGRPTPRSRILANVFARFYIGGLQPLLAARMQAHEAWVRELAGFATELDEVATPAFRDWFAHVVDPATASSEWRRTRHAVVEHAGAWQRLFDACGLDPRSAVGQD